MNNQIILYNNQKIDCLIYSSTAFSLDEKTEFNENQELSWNDFTNPKIICNFTENLASSYLQGVEDTITGYEISKKRPEENFAKLLGRFDLEEIATDKEDEGFYCLVDYNVKNNNKYTYFVSALTEDYIQATLSNESNKEDEEPFITKWDVFSLTPIQKVSEEENTYKPIKDEFSEDINWTFYLDCKEGDITLNQDKTSFTTFASKPKISIGDLNYYTGSLSCLLGDVLYNNTYYEPNALLEKWEKMIKENYIYLFKNPKGDAMIVSLEDGVKKQYKNEVLNYYMGTYNGETAITTRPTTIEFSYMEVLDAENIQVYGG